MAVTLLLGGGIRFSTMAWADSGNLVTGTVDNALGQPVPEVMISVRCLGHPCKLASGRTDQHGEFSFQGWPDGRYQLVLTAPGYQSAAQVVRVDSAHRVQQLRVHINSQQALLFRVKRKPKVVKSRLDNETGTDSYQMSRQDIAQLPEGENTAINQVLLQAPGVVQDSFGQIHVRGDHADVQYRLNGLWLPDSVGGLGDTMDTHFVEQMNLITGALPARYGFETAGIVDIRTRSGAFASGGMLGMQVGSYGEQNVYGDVAGHQGKLNYYLSMNLLRTDLGLENPVGSSNPLHDHSNQGKGMGYFSWATSEVSRWSLLLGTTTNRFQIPDVPGLNAPYTPYGIQNTPSSSLNEQQVEQTQFAMLSYEGVYGEDLSYQISYFSRYTDVNFQPDTLGDLAFYGLSSQVLQSGWANGLQSDAVWRPGKSHTVRFGEFLSDESLSNQSTLQALPGNAAGQQTGNTPVSFMDRGGFHAYEAGIYVEDSWKATQRLTLNYGVRLDRIDAYVNAAQLSPRLGSVYQFTPATAVHLGYSRYFTPPPTEQIASATIGAAQGTLAAPAVTTNDRVQPERSHYFDLGIDHTLSAHWSVSADSYYRLVTNLLDEGQFGSAMLFTPFNYQYGKVYGIELGSNYHNEQLTAYVNVARSAAFGKNITSSEYVFAPAELAYIQNNWIHLDHDQTWTASGGVGYVLDETHFNADVLAGSGLRNGFANTTHLPGYMTMNFSVGRQLMAGSLGALDGRVGVTNVLNRIYEIRDGTGVGIGAPQFGAMRGYYLSINKNF